MDKIYRLLIIKYKKQIIIIFVMSLFATALSVFLPIVEQNIIDWGFLKKNIDIVAIFSGVILLILVLGNIIEYHQISLMNSIQNEIMIDAKLAIYEHALKLKPGEYKTSGFLKILSDALYDMERILGTIENSFLSIFSIIIKTLGALIALIIIDWKLCIIVILFMPIKYMINRYVSNRLQRISEDELSAYKEFNQWTSNLIYSVIDIKIWDLRKRVVQEAKNHIQKIIMLDRKSLLTRQKSNCFSEILNMFLTCVLYLLGIILLVNQRITLGGLLAFISYSVYLISPIDIILSLKASISEIRPSIDSVSSFFAMNVDDISEGTMPDKIEKISFENVTVKTEDNVILDDISFSIHAGERVAIVGENGSGKTTILNLLLKIVDPSLGTIMINGSEIKEIDTEKYRLSFSVVTQHVNLFNSDIIENITLGSGTAYQNLKELEESENILKELSNRLYDSVGSCGSVLSGGEKQKIAFMRAYCNRRQILILDEVTSNLDECSRRKIYELLRKTDAFNIIIAVTHDLDILEQFDKIIMLKNGKIEDIRRGN